MQLADQRLSDSLHNLQIMREHGGLTIPSPHNVNESLVLKVLLARQNISWICLHALYLIVTFQ